jgi:hypothetical protein
MQINRVIKAIKKIDQLVEMLLIEESVSIIGYSS